MTRRRPGYDIYGAPTKVDPRDYPDPLTIEPDEPLVRFRAQPRPRRFWGCSVWPFLLLAVWWAVWR